MKTTILALVALLSSTFVFSQDITGLWTGTIKDDPTGNSLPYEVYIKKEKGKLSGYSKTWYVVDGKQCYGIKKLKVNIAKDGKIVLLDDAWMENDHPYADKDFKQLDVLDLINNDEGSSLNGFFATKIKRYHETTGKIQLKKTDSFTESTLISYLKKINGENDITAVK